jgi:CDP-diacylglycerol--glycerol-3-phosphate 3-phosphatidyltransferase
MKRDFLTVPNLLSLLRIVLAVPFAAVMLSSHPDSRVWATVIIVLAALTDKLDGVLARKLHQESEWGRILDPVADKIGVATAAVVLLVLGELPLWFAGMVLGRDVLILAGGLVLKTRRGVVIPSNVLGKWTVGAMALLIFLLVIRQASLLTDVLLVLCTCLLAISLLEYVRVFIAALAKVQQDGQ